MAGHRRIRSPQGTGGNGAVEVATRLAELTDVTITAAAAGDYLRHNGTAWVDVTAAQIIADINSGLDHGTLAGLTDDDHTQYPLLAGRSGGQTLYGGTGAAENLYLHSTTNATKGGIYFDLNLLVFTNGTNGFLRGGGDIGLQPGGGNVLIYDSAFTNYLDLSHSTNGIIGTNTGGLLLSPNNSAVGIGAVNTSFYLNVEGSNSNIAQLRSTAAGAVGAVIRLTQNSASPADNDRTGTIDFYATSDTAQRNIGRCAMRFNDVTDTTMDSSWEWGTMDNVNAAGFNTTATLTSVGVWTDASAEKGKTFEGEIPDILNKILQLPVQKYRSSRVPAHKRADAERHYSPSAEAFWDVFGLGVDPRRIYQDKDGRQFKRAGIAPKDLAGVALGGLQKIIPMIEDLLVRVTNLEGAA